LNYYSFFEFNLDLEEKNKKNPETSSITFNNLLQIHIYKGEESAPRERENEKPVVGVHLPRAKSVPPLNSYFSSFFGF
jgi:hypothetical protein